MSKQPRSSHCHQHLCLSASAVSVSTCVSLGSRASSTICLAMTGRPRKANLPEGYKFKSLFDNQPKVLGEKLPSRVEPRPVEPSADNSWLGARPILLRELNRLRAMTPLERGLELVDPIGLAEAMVERFKGCVQACMTCSTCSIHSLLTWLPFTQVVRTWCAALLISC